ncbi:hypothetical protein ACQQ2Q_12540 [Agrobacterium sp. ES01]|uniref:hypothetical protein n=1 Tax=Agrobacterium sp. ES01 TaxID=3420714 RepID=UPI003D0AB91A
MTNTTYRPQARRVRAVDSATHIFAIGETVRMKSSLPMKAEQSAVYQITAQLPVRENLPQYRVRSEDERHERVTTQDMLELVGRAKAKTGSNLMERTFGHG